MEKTRRPVNFLASVTNESEARLCASLGADIIDAKNPAVGALGALPPERISAIRACVPARIPVSATIGDPSEDPEHVASSARLAAATGVDIDKIGFWPGAAHERTARRLGKLALPPVRLVAVLLVDRGLELGLIGPLRDAGFSGVMLDTEDKGRGALPELVPATILEAFVDAASVAGLFAGFAGSLRLEHVPYLLTFGPGVLGFRGGLCQGRARTAGIDAAAVRALRRACGSPLRGAIAPLQSERAL